jgi:hypothetical protein
MSVEERLEAIERKLDRVLKVVEHILEHGTGRPPGRITEQLQEHGQILRRIEDLLGRDNGDEAG